MSLNTPVSNIMHTSVNLKTDGDTVFMVDKASTCLICQSLIEIYIYSVGTYYLHFHAAQGAQILPGNVSSFYKEV